MSIENFWGEKTFFEKLLVFSIILGHWAKQFPAFCRKVFVGVVTTASYMSSGTFGGRINSCLTFSFCYRFRTLSKTISGLLSKSFRRCSHNCILHVLWNIRRKNDFLFNFLFLLSFSDIERKFVNFLSKSFGRVCQNCILRVHGNNSRKNIF